MRTLFLHIGDSKTGSSAIQSSLYLSRADLADRHDLVYPAGRQRGTDARAITSGNAEGVLADPESLERALAQVAEERADQRPQHLAGVVFSSEFMFVELLAADDITFLPQVARRHGFEQIEVLLFIRNPVAQAISVWQQSVKRGGSTDSLDELLATFEAPCRVERVVDALEALADVRVTILNYSTVHDRLLDEVSAWLDVERGSLIAPPIRINRSLSDGELVLQRALNAELGRDGRVLADALCEQLPDVEPAHLAPSEAAQRELWERVRPSAERVNRRLEPPHHYRFDRVPPSEPDLALSAAQLEVIGATMGRAVTGREIARRPPAAGLVLHIGPHKTATSVLQGAFASSAGRLAEHGVVYSAVGRHGDAQHELAWTLFDPEQGGHLLAADRTLATWSAVRDELAELDPAERLLVSSEDLCFLGPPELDALAQALDGVDVDVLVGVRDPVVAVPSMWQESVKWGEQWPLEEAAGALLEDPELRLLPLIDRWRRHLPGARFRSFVVPSGGAASMSSPTQRRHWTCHRRR